MQKRTKGLMFEMKKLYIIINCQAFIIVQQVAYNYLCTPIKSQLIRETSILQLFQHI
ncbi:hypothetical protein pb186bvf_004433 [Paramecium bursaria]